MKDSIVWFDIPVKDLNRASTFYSNVLNVKMNYNDPKFRAATLEWEKGNIAGCLYESNQDETSDKGPLLYFDIDSSLEDAESKVKQFEGSVLESKHSVAPFGFRSIVLDSEGNRIGLHSSN